MTYYRKRTPDSDLQAYLRNNTDIYSLEDIETVCAEIAGHNDEDSWFWILKLKDGRYILTKASCDYTGWDCSSEGKSWQAKTAIQAAKLAPELDYGRQIRRNLLEQLRKKQPFGLETIYNTGEA